MNKFTLWASQMSKLPEDWRLEEIPGFVGLMMNAPVQNRKEDLLAGAGSLSRLE